MPPGHFWARLRQEDSSKLPASPVGVLVVAEDRATEDAIHRSSRSLVHSLSTCNGRGCGRAGRSPSIYRTMKLIGWEPRRRPPEGGGGSGRVGARVPVGQGR